MSAYQKAMLALARKFYPASEYSEATDEQLLRWLSCDASKAASEVKRG